MPISCRVISLCSFFLDSSVTFDTIGHLLLHKKHPSLGLCDTNLLFLHLADSLRELVLMDPLFLPRLCWHLSRLCHHSLLPPPSHCLGVFASCPGPSYFPELMTLKSALLPVQPFFCGILCWTPHGFLRCCVPKDERAAFFMAAILLITSLCTCLMVILTTPSVLSPCNHFFLKYCYLPSLFFHFLWQNFTQVVSQWTELNFLWPLFSFGIVSCSICYKTCSSRLFPTSFQNQQI